MKIIQNKQDLIGKLISKVESIDYDDYLVLVFDDSTYCAIGKTDQYGDCCDIGLISEIGLYNKKVVGIITEEEYEILMEKARLEDEERLRECKLNALKILKAKYES